MNRLLVPSGVSDRQILSYAELKVATACGEQHRAVNLVPAFEAAQILAVLGISNVPAIVIAARSLEVRLVFLEQNLAHRQRGLSSTRIYY